MTSLTQFAFNSQQVRIVSINNEPWFVAQDVCDILDIRNVSKACNPLKDREKQVLNLHEMGITSSDDPDTTRLLAVSESGLYRLTMKSRKPQAEPFQDWVCEQILPIIRKTGKYELAPSQPALPQNYIEALEADILRKEKVLFNSDGTNLPYASWQNEGLATIRDGQCFDGRMRFSPVFSWKGLDRILDLLRKHQVIPRDKQYRFNFDSDKIVAMKRA